jgi:hypothetical protein
MIEKELAVLNLKFSKPETFDEALSRCRRDRNLSQPDEVFLLAIWRAAVESAIAEVQNNTSKVRLVDRLARLRDAGRP